VYNWHGWGAIEPSLVDLCACFCHFAVNSVIYDCLTVTIMPSFKVLPLNSFSDSIPPCPTKNCPIGSVLPFRQEHFGGLCGEGKGNTC